MQACTYAHTGWVESEFEFLRLLFFLSSLPNPNSSCHHVAGDEEEADRGETALNTDYMMLRRGG